MKKSVFEKEFVMVGKTYFQGSASSLKGKIYSLIIFISEKGRIWSQSEKMAILNTRQVAINWIEQQARRYGVSLTFLQVGCYGFDDDLIVDCIPTSCGTGKEYAYWVPYLLEKMNWQNPIQFYNHMKLSTVFDNLHVEIYANKKGRCYAMSFPLGGNQESFVEGIFCYRASMNHQNLNPASIAHEVLHTYGAWDLYQTFKVSAKQAEYAEYYFKNDIMHRNSINFDELVIDTLIAWRIGWIPKKEDWYDFFDPDNNAN